MHKNTVMSYDRFVDDRLLTSRDALNKIQIKMKMIDFDENARDFSQRFGSRILVRKILLTMKHVHTEEIEEKELDLEIIEKRMKKERLFSSSNRWVSPNEMKNGYIVASRHVDLLADAFALDVVTIDDGGKNDDYKESEFVSNEKKESGAKKNQIDVKASERGKVGLSGSNPDSLAASAQDLEGKRAQIEANVTGRQESEPHSRSSATAGSAKNLIGKLFGLFNEAKKPKQHDSS
jgi:hypothetical protein